jgi:hypothetical protein
MIGSLATGERRESDKILNFLGYRRLPKNTPKNTLFYSCLLLHEVQSLEGTIAHGHNLLGHLQLSHRIISPP